MYNDLFSIGSLTIHTYGLMTAIGIIAAYFTAEYRVKKNGLDETKIFGFLIWCLVFGYLCSKILYWITILPSIIDDPSIIIRTLTNGWVVYGGILGGILGGFLYCRRNKLHTLRYFDIAAGSLALAQGFGRIGCFFAGCCYGVETDSAFSIVFTNSSFAPNDVRLVPTQLISSALDFSLFVLLVLLYRRKKHKPGQCVAAYLICYSVGRFVLEFFRGDVQRGSVGILSTSQFIAIFTLLAGILLFLYISKRGDTMEKSERKAAIFDLDGTLLDTLESIAKPTNVALKKFGYEERPMEAFKTYVGDGYRNSVKRALADCGENDEEMVEKVYEYGIRLYTKYPTYKNKPYPNIKNTLQGLKEKGIKLAVLTNKPHVAALAVIEKCFGEGFFDIVQGQEDGHPKKPKPGCADNVLETLGVSAAECVYFGDSNTDMKTGKETGFYTVGVAWGFRPVSELKEAGADLIINEPKEIAELFQNINFGEYVWEKFHNS